MLNRHRWAAVGALIVGLVVPVAASGAADAQEAPPEETAKVELPVVPVVESTTGSYVVVMVDDPLVASIAQDDLETPAAEAAGDELVAAHDEVLAEAGISPDERIQSFTNAVNGFAATLTYEQAVKLVEQPGGRDGAARRAAAAHHRLERRVPRSRRPRRRLGHRAHR